MADATVVNFAEHVLSKSALEGIPSGRYLVRSLPEGAQKAIEGKRWNPFYKDMCLTEIVDWVDHHIVFDDNEVVEIRMGCTRIWRAGDQPISITMFPKNPTDPKGEWTFVFSSPNGVPGGEEETCSRWDYAVECVRSLLDEKVGY